MLFALLQETVQTAELRGQSPCGEPWMRKYTMELRNRS